MIKNLFLLGFMTWVSLSYAGPQDVAHESITEAETFKVSKPVEEQAAKRSMAGSKIKKKDKTVTEPEKGQILNEPDSEVRYWQYSEE